MVISFILATGVGAGFGVTKDLKRIMDILNKLSGNDLGSKLDYFFNKTYVSAGFLFIGFLTSGISSITSLLALSKKE
ncbi:CASP-like protein 4D1 [Camellia lanceoleosa]|uniref:CASP-like protein 4D1 n=1 Tax=Camellia lanceoleosa TaxID=1840588 RepID=A0ACC0G2S3_9ERIC|nr:CASP-like protein 4D1 [Camellia lanceoleosa]